MRSGRFPVFTAFSQVKRTDLRFEESIRFDFYFRNHILLRIQLVRIIGFRRKYIKSESSVIPFCILFTLGRIYCENGILNAVLNNIADSCENAEITFDLDVDIPEMGEHQSVDVATFLQNLGENAILGCETVPPRERRFALSVKAVHGDELFIVSTNTFDGKVLKEDHYYYSTRLEESGSGLGIPSMRSITSKYGGTLEVSNTHSEFLINARMKLK